MQLPQIVPPLLRPQMKVGKKKNIFSFLSLLLFLSSFPQKFYVFCPLSIYRTSSTGRFQFIESFEGLFALSIFFETFRQSETPFSFFCSFHTQGAIMQRQEIRRVVKEEKETLDYFSNLSNEQHEQLAGGQRSLPEAMKAAKAAKEAKEKFDKLKQEKDRKVELAFQTTKLEEKNLMKRGTEMEDKHKMEFEKLAGDTEEEKKRIEYALKKTTDALQDRVKAKLEAKKEFDRIHFERKRKEEAEEEYQAMLRRKEREDEYERMTKLEKIKIEMEAEMERKAEVELAEHRFQQNLRMHEATQEEEARKLRELKRLEMESDKLLNKQKWDSILNYFHGDEGKERAFNIAKLTGMMAALAGASWIVVPVVGKVLRKKLYAPRLVQRQNKRRGPLSLLGGGSGGEKIDVILRENLERRMEKLLKSTQKTSERKGFYGNLLLYGRPGTGKTLWAEKLAQEAQMEFAVMSGPSFDQFQRGQAIQEIRDLFEWAKSRKNGVLLFVDEADSFLEDRSTLNPHRVAVLNEWINQTGTESEKFMCVYETNRPEVLDPAVMSRVTSSVEFEVPTEKEVFRLLKLYGEKYVMKDQSNGWRSSQGLSAPLLTDDEYLTELASDLAKEGFVGRDISNLCINLFRAGVASDSNALTKEDINQVVEEQLQKKQSEKKYLDLRNERLEEHKRKLLSAFL